MPESEIVSTETTAPGLEELMSAARKLATEEQAVPSKRTLQNALSVGFYRASEIHRVLLAESEASRRERERQVAVARTQRGALPAHPSPASDPAPAAPVVPVAAPPAPVPYEQVAAVTEAASPAAVTPLPKRVPRWPLLLLATPAFVAIWAGWVELGRLTGFGPMHPLPGIADRFSINTAITLPVGLETYAAYAMFIWLSRAGSTRARAFAGISALLSLLLGFAGQGASHLMIASGMAVAPWPITLAVSGVPVLVLGMGAALWHMVHTD